mmetsp:Transcript_5154/g.17538  ORF Transcript_5154/g.17538 Transcript_5154/m.17538 type:complete len:301 (-) Transcript_5154:19-921(-)
MFLSFLFDSCRFKVSSNCALDGKGSQSVRINNSASLKKFTAAALSSSSSSSPSPEINLGTSPPLLFFQLVLKSSPTFASTFGASFSAYSLNRFAASYALFSPNKIPRHLFSISSSAYSFEKFTIGTCVCVCFPPFVVVLVLAKGAAKLSNAHPFSTHLIKRKSSETGQSSRTKMISSSFFSSSSSFVVFFSFSSFSSSFFASSSSPPFASFPSSFSFSSSLFVSGVGNSWVRSNSIRAFSLKVFASFAFLKAQLDASLSTHSSSSFLVVVVVAASGVAASGFSSSSSSFISSFMFLLLLL